MFSAPRWSIRRRLHQKRSCWLSSRSYSGPARSLPAGCWHTSAPAARGIEDTPMNAAHIHLLLNHFPTIGFAVGLGLFVVGLFGRSDELKKASLVIFFLTAAMTIATYVSGSDAHEALKDTPGVSAAMISAHEGAALVAFIFMQVTGFFSWIALWLLRRVSRLYNWNLAVVLVLSVVTFVLMARASTIGGEIRHPEIQSSAEAAASGADPAPTIASSWRLYVQSNSYVWPTCETVHFIGLSMLFAVVMT